MAIGDGARADRYFSGSFAKRSRHEAAQKKYSLPFHVYLWGVSFFTDIPHTGSFSISLDANAKRTLG
jgi:hypothetical protein